MTRSEYEARRRQLDEEMRAAIELVRAGHQAQVQALELVWKRSAEGAPEPEAPPSPEPDALPRRRGAGELRAEVEEILLRLPEVFTKNDVEKLLAVPADRASLYRVFQELRDDGLIKAEDFGRGRNPAVYRQLDFEDGEETA
jgi:hypothetical protein